MSKNINITMEIELTTKVNLTPKEYQSLVNDIKKELKTYTELRICDLAYPHTKLFEGYNLWMRFNK